MLSVVRFNDGLGHCWNEFVSCSKNGTFLHHRSFMEYHRDRFVDHSVLVYDEQTLVAIMPASEHGSQIRSHGGLTYGGIISTKKMTADTMVAVVQRVLAYYYDKGFQSITYKPSPSIYHKMPSQEDLYAVTLWGARLWRRDVAACIDLQNRAPIQTRRKRGIAKFNSAGIKVTFSNDWSSFIDMEAALLKEKYGTAPVHTAAELQMLANMFPDNIKLLVAIKDGELLAGTTIFDCGNCVHLQYISSTERGRQLYALDGLFNAAIELYKDKRWFDFGISTEHDGKVLNVGLANNKESWGARSIVYDHYVIDLTSNLKGI